MSRFDRNLNLKSLGTLVSVGLLGCVGCGSTVTMPLEQGAFATVEAQDGFDANTDVDVEGFDFSTVDQQRVTLLVVDAKNNPITDAEVVAFVGNEQGQASVVAQAKTDDDGTVTLDLPLRLKDDLVTLTVSKPLYVTTDHELHLTTFAGDDVTLELDVD